MGPGAGLDRCGKSRPTGIRSPDLPARSVVAIPTTLPRLPRAISTTYNKSLYRRKNRLEIFNEIIISLNFLPTKRVHISNKEVC
jgi:hypothetical protein